MPTHCYVERIEYFRNDSEHLALTVRHICESNGEMFTHGTSSEAQPQPLPEPHSDHGPWHALVEPVTIPRDHAVIAVGRNLAYLAELGRGTQNDGPLLTWQQGYATTHAPRAHVDGFLRDWFILPVRNLLDTQLSLLTTEKQVTPLVESALDVITSSVAAGAATRSAYEVLVAGITNDEGRMELAEVRRVIDHVDNLTLVEHLSVHLTRLLRENRLSSQAVYTLSQHTNPNLAEAATRVL